MNKQEIKAFLINEINESLVFLKNKNKKESLLGNVMANKARHYPDEVKKELDSVIKPDINDNLMSHIYCFLNDIDEYPKCKICGKDIKRFKSYAPVGMIHVLKNVQILISMVFHALRLLNLYKKK